MLPIWALKQEAVSTQNCPNTRLFSAESCVYEVCESRGIALDPWTQKIEVRAPGEKV